MKSADKAVWIVCEDGTEYLHRFSRFLSTSFDFEHAADAESLIHILANVAPSGILMDLDFRRIPGERLVDESGQSGLAIPEAERKRLSQNQGILILRYLRARGITTPTILCADLEDAEQRDYLERTLNPLEIAPSSEGLAQTALRMHRLSSKE